MVTDIEMARIVPHPENSNRMDAETLTKLRRHIKHTTRYEPLVVRPHPVQAACFEIINGHNRFEVLKTLGHVSAKCIVWAVNDEQTRIYLATLNRLSGEDIPERRALLLGSLLERFASEELAQLLPESKDQLAELENMARIEAEDILLAPQPTRNNTPRVILEFYLEQNHAKEVNVALDAAIQERSGALSRPEALLQLARSYLAHDDALRREANEG